MKKRLCIACSLLATVFVAGILHGITIHRNQVFPYRVIRHVCRRLQASGSFSIGIYEGRTPFTLVEPEGIFNPVLTARDVADADAVFVADPFMIAKDGTHFMFFEVLKRGTYYGVIAYAESSDLKQWTYKKVVLDEGFHLSYPFVFEWDDSYYMIPESAEDLSVRLYRATEFPGAWEYVGNLLGGYRYVDPTVFRHSDKWWMFVCTGHNSILNLYYSDDLFEGWRPHPMNPIVKSNRHTSRPAGRVVAHEGRLYRLAQDTHPSYGIQVFAFEITDLSETSYAERPAAEKPIVGKTGVGWNAAGMHHADLHQTESGWVAAVDGRYR